MSVETESLISQLEAAGRAAIEDIDRSSQTAELEQLRVRHLGKKSLLQTLSRKLGEVTPEQRPKIGQVANRVKAQVNQALQDKLDACRRQEIDRRLASESIDVTLPGRPIPQGHPHPLMIALDEIESIFTSMGFEIATGPDMEEDYYNFEALNIPPDHPARDMHDTFYLEGGGLLRTHTSPVQIRAMRRRGAPLAVIAPGKVYRYEATDDKHLSIFHQVEAFLVGENVSFSDLKGVLGYFLRSFFSWDLQFRLRPSYFPFTEPSAEVDIEWKAPGKPPQWMEVLGAGMIHPKVLEAGGIDPAKYTGFAFGLGVERFALLKYGIPSARLFNENDLRFLGQF